MPCAYMRRSEPGSAPGAGAGALSRPRLAPAGATTNRSMRLLHSWGSETRWQRLQPGVLGGAQHVALSCRRASRLPCWSVFFARLGGAPTRTAWCDAAQPPLRRRRAMGGSVPFQDALRQRLDVMQVSQQDMARYLASHPPRLSKGGQQGGGGRAGSRACLQHGGSGARQRPCRCAALAEPSLCCGLCHGPTPRPHTYAHTNHHPNTHVRA